MEILANYIYYGRIPEYVRQLVIGEKQADLFADSILKTIVEKDIFKRLNITNKHDFNKILDFNPKYLLTTDNDFTLYMTESEN